MRPDGFRFRTTGLPLNVVLITMSWRTNPQAVPHNPRDFAEKIDALGWKGLSSEERRLAVKDARAISAFLPEASGKALLTLAGVPSKEWVPSLEKKGGKYALIEKIKAKAILKRQEAAKRANLENT